VIIDNHVLRHFRSPGTTCPTGDIDIDVWTQLKRGAFYGHNEVLRLLLGRDNYRIITSQTVMTRRRYNSSHTNKVMAGLLLDRDCADTNLKNKRDEIPP
jgi:hypothetical protein